MKTELTREDGTWIREKQGFPKSNSPKQISPKRKGVNTEPGFPSQQATGGSCPSSSQTWQVALTFQFQQESG